MIRQATEQDIAAITQTYTELLLYEQENGSSSNWKLNVYPTENVPKTAIPKGTMYVLEENNTICASMVLNGEQDPAYAAIPWRYEADPSEVSVVHTLCIPPSKAGNGYGKKMVSFAKEHAKNNGCTVIRIDTSAENEPAKSLYIKNGFRIAGYAPVLFQGLIPEELVFLEYKL